MTDVDIDPKLLRAIRTAALHDARLSDELCDELEEWATRLEPIEKWAQILHDAAAPVDGAWVYYEHAPAGMRETARRQARAVLAKLEQDQSRFDEASIAPTDYKNERGCMAIRPDIREPYVCTLSLGHEGPHKAAGANEVFATWEDR